MPIMKSKVKTAMVPLPAIEDVIHLVRGQKVILDADLARLYGVPTKALNQAVKRNSERFSEEFMFQLTSVETRALDGMRSQIVTSTRRNLRYQPFAFTEHGALMAANILNSQQAVKMSVVIIKTFVRLRRLLADHSALARKIAILEQKYDSHGEAIQEIFRAVKSLMQETKSRRPARREIGFHTHMPPQTKKPRPRP